MFSFMKIVSIAEMRELDRRAIQDYGIPGMILMENAGLRAADLIKKWCRKPFAKKSIVIVCGRGNNGGDGFVIARHLLNHGFSVIVFVLGHREDITADPLTHWTILEKMACSLYFTGTSLPDEHFSQRINTCDFIVDAIFGTGLDRPIEDPTRAYISRMNHSHRPVIAIDTPSGLNCDTGEVWGIAVKARHTITMAVAKKGFFMNKGPAYTGIVHVVDISIPRQREFQFKEKNLKRSRGY